MRILLYGINYAPELIGIGKYSSEMAAWLAGVGHEVRVVTSLPYYPAWKVGEPYKNWRYTKEKLRGVTVYRSPLFVPTRPSTAKRLFHLLSFAALSLPQLLRQILWKPDLVFVVVPTFFCVPAGLLMAKLCGARAWLHIQDLELDAWVGLRNGHSLDKLIRVEGMLERQLMGRFDQISTISHSMSKRISDTGIPEDKLILSPNWVDVDFITPHADSDYYRQRWGYREEQRIVMYSGNLGEKQGLEMILEVADAFRDDETVQFVIVGDGAYKSRLQGMTVERGIKNVQFFPLQPYDRLPELMCFGDVHLVPQRRGVAEAVFPSKLATILASGRTAIATADPESELGRVMNHGTGIGHLVEPSNPAQLIGTLRMTLDGIDPNRRGHNARARGYAEMHLGRRNILGRLESQIRSLSGGPR